MVAVVIYFSAIFIMIITFVIYKICNKYLKPSNAINKWFTKHLIINIDDNIICDSYDRILGNSVLDDESSKELNKNY